MARRVLVAVLLLLAACGGGSDAFTNRSAEAVAEKMGCSDLSLSHETKLLTREHGTCTLNGESVEVHTYTDNKTQGQAEDFLSNSGLGTGVRVEGDGWVVFCTSEATCKRVQNRLGGNLR